MPNIPRRGGNFIVLLVRSTLDTLPTYCKARVLILGVGNVLFGDDGFGPAVVDYIVQHFCIPDDVYVMDVGTGVRKLLFTLTLSETRPEKIIIVDAVDGGRGDNLVSEIPVEALPITKVDDFSLHQVPTSNMLLELQDSCDVCVTVIACDVGVVPQEINPGLSPETLQAVAEAGQLIASGFNLAPISSK